MPYVCPDHPDQPVTWRGTGCPDPDHRGRRVTGGQRRPNPERDAINAVIARWDARHRNPKIND